MRIIDSHMHLGLGPYDEKKILSEMDRKGVGSTWLLTWEEVSPPVPELNIELPPDPLLELAQRHPDRFLPFYAPDPRRKDACELLEANLAKGIRGCAELKVSIDWDDPSLDDYLALVNRHRLPLIFHMEDAYPYYRMQGKGRLEWAFSRLANDKYNGRSRYFLDRLSATTGVFRKKLEKGRVHFPGILPSFDALESRIREFPQIRFIGHGPHFWNNIADRLSPRYIHQKGKYEGFGPIDRLLEQYDNFYCDLSGLSAFNALQRDRRQAALFISKHAASLLYGTDNTPYPLLELLEQLKPGREKLEAILSGNALRLMENM